MHYYKFTISISIDSQDANETSQEFPGFTQVRVVLISTFIHSVSTFYLYFHFLMKVLGDIVEHSVASESMTSPIQAVSQIGNFQAGNNDGQIKKRVSLFKKSRMS